MRLHEIELYNGNPRATADFYRNAIGLDEMGGNDNLRIFSTGWPHLDLNVSDHYAAYPVSLSFLVKDIEAVKQQLTSGGAAPGEIRDSHLGMKAFDVIAPGNIRLVFQMPTDASPEWLQQMA